MRGEIKFYKSGKGFGFIKTEEGPDIFFHVSSLAQCNENDILNGVPVSFEAITGPDGREKAVNVNILK